MYDRVNFAGVMCPAEPCEPAGCKQLAKPSPVPERIEHRQSEISQPKTRPPADC